jgi:peptidoglycan hydrolase-like protein with peptidoglycan-binding domain
MTTSLLSLILIFVISGVGLTGLRLLQQETFAQVLCGSSTVILSIGSRGPEVTDLQKILMELGYSVGPAGADGDFGENTQSAVAEFQQDNDIAVTGIVDSYTLDALCSFTVIASPTIRNSLEFIQNPETSTLDMLPGEAGKQYKDFSWNYYDYPGVSRGDPGNGPNEQMAREMFADLAKISPERRPNIGGTAILTKDKVTQDLWDYVQNEMVPVQGPHKLNKYAAESFAQMYAAAKSDGVDLVILDSDRLPEQSQASAAVSGNPFAVASFSSHNLGLAIDFQMSQGNQKYFETTTRPMKNIINMMQSPVHKWLFQNAEAYGWYPWNFEPWHWEYNPDNFRSKFYANCNCDPMP